MKQKIKRIIKDFIPPFICREIPNLLGLRMKFRKFQTYNHALKYVNKFNQNIRSSSKNHPIISNTLTSLHQRANNSTREYHTVTNAFFIVKGISKAKNFVFIDFGGGGGSTYFDNKSLLSLMGKYSWNVCELPEIVAHCKKYEDGIISFHSDLNEISNKYTVEGNIKILLLSGVLMYLEDGFTFLQQLVDRIKPDAIIFDRTAISNNNQIQFFSQYVPKKLGGRKANLYISYPKNNFLDFFQKNNFSIFNEFRSYIDSDQKFFSMRGILAIKDKLLI